jgi:hypothetical protein
MNFLKELKEFNFREQKIFFFLFTLDLQIAARVTFLVENLCNFFNKEIPPIKKKTKQITCIIKNNEIIPNSITG